MSEWDKVDIFNSNMLKLTKGGLFICACIPTHSNTHTGWVGHLFELKRDRLLGHVEKGHNINIYDCMWVEIHTHTHITQKGKLRRDGSVVVSGVLTMYTQTYINIYKVQG